MGSDLDVVYVVSSATETIRVFLIYTQHQPLNTAQNVRKGRGEGGDQKLSMLVTVLFNLDKAPTHKNCNAKRLFAL